MTLKAYTMKEKIDKLKNKFKIFYGDFPGGSVAKNSPSNAGGSGSIPGQGTKTPHKSGQLSLCTTKAKTTGLN